MENEKQTVRHDVIMTGRCQMHLTGIDDVSSFDENGIFLDMGEEGISIEGERLHIEAFDSDRKELSLTGQITGFFYYKKGPKKGKRPLFGRG
ncbi:MAG: YabP/YqfC family sporulation protein [Clostridia bacterium]|nr:YabP/YqfC family sporulation protein [Clostridia bacterium]